MSGIGFLNRTGGGMARAEVERIADALRTAADAGTTVLQSELYPTPITLEEAYRIQHYQATRTGPRAGLKMGLTSRAKMRQVNVDSPIAGFLPQSAACDDGAPISMAGMGQPRVEPEIVFVMGRDVDGPLTAAQAFDAVAYVGIGIEILDSRYRDFKFTLPDVVADNTSAKKFVTGGTWLRPSEINLENLGMVMEVNGVPRGYASTAAILDHPIRSLVALSKLATTFDERGFSWLQPMFPLRRGEIVLAGAPMEAVPVQSGDSVTIRCQKLGSATANFC
jgi:2-oxo-3-hexenedioate decarboxylase